MNPSDSQPGPQSAAERAMLERLRAATRWYKPNAAEKRRIAAMLRRGVTDPVLLRFDRGQ